MAITGELTALLAEESSVDTGASLVRGATIAALTRVANQTRFSEDSILFNRLKYGNTSCYLCTQQAQGNNAFVHKEGIFATASHKAGEGKGTLH